MVDSVRYKGVTVEANYDVGEYDVSILSAKESDGLVNWLTDNGYKIPHGAEAVLGSYIRQNMRFFVAKVNLERMALIGGNYLRPLQVRYDTAKFMLPLRLGTVNANGPQDLIVYALTKNGRVEADQLPHREAAVRHRRAALRQERIRQLLQGDVRAGGEEGEHARGVRRIRLGHGLVRPVRRRSAQQQGTGRTRRALDRRRQRHAVPPSQAAAPTPT